MAAEHGGIVVSAAIDHHFGRLRPRLSDLAPYRELRSTRRVVADAMEAAG
jgi:hypothetical protein